MCEALETQETTCDDRARSRPGWSPARVFSRDGRRGGPSSCCCGPRRRAGELLLPLAAAAAPDRHLRPVCEDAPRTEGADDGCHLSLPAPRGGSSVKRLEGEQEKMGACGRCFRRPRVLLPRTTSVDDSGDAAPARGCAPATAASPFRRGAALGRLAANAPEPRPTARLRHKPGRPQS